jgi:hypothetical protein
MKIKKKKQKILNERETKYYVTISDNWQCHVIWLSSSRILDYIYHFIYVRVFSKLNIHQELKYIFHEITVLYVCLCNRLYQLLNA